MSQRRLAAILALVAVVALPTLAAFWLAGSGDGGVRDNAAERSVVLAPSSLAVVQDLLDEVLASHEIVEPDWVFAGSHSLVAQLIDGAPADVLLTANRATFDRAKDADVTGPTEFAFAENHLVLAVADGNPGAVQTIDDLSNPGLLVGVCAVEVPCGQLVLEASETLGFELDVDTEEPSVRSLSTKLLTGELDAAIIYRTEAISLGLGVIPVPGLDDHRTTYWASALTDNDAVLEFLLSDDGQAILRDAGFGR